MPLPACPPRRAAREGGRFRARDQAAQPPLDFAFTAATTTLRAILNDRVAWAIADDFTAISAISRFAMAHVTSIPVAGTP